MLWDIVRKSYLVYYKKKTFLKGVRAGSTIMWIKRHYSPSKSTKLKTL